MSAHAGEPGAEEEVSEMDADAVRFEIAEFEITGNSVLSPEFVADVLAPFIGQGKSASDVEAARAALEKAYHAGGWPTVFVNIPEQTVEGGIVRLEVMEGLIGQVTVTGNRWHTMERIRKALPSVKTGRLIHIPQLTRELEGVNRTPDMTVTLGLVPGEEPGTVDVDLQVEDHLPLHGRMELNNRNSPDTTDLRLNALVRYDNLWQRDHSVSFQWQTSPEDGAFPDDWNDTEVFAFSYVLPAPWKRDHVLAAYGVSSDSETASGEGFEVLGRGRIYGLRYVVPLTPYHDYTHNVTLGYDYKDFDEDLALSGEPGLKTPITYSALSCSYAAFLPDRGGITQFNGGVFFTPRGLVTDRDEFEIKRYGARGNYIYATLGVERNQKLPWKAGLYAKLDGQLADQPLISNEQYTAGGMESVRGYEETEESGDQAVHGSFELRAPAVTFRKADATVFAFYDFASLSLKNPLEEQDGSVTLEGAGVGARGGFTKHLKFDVAWAVALSGTGNTASGDRRIHFSLRGEF